MKIKVDENMPLRLSLRLRELGHEVKTVLDEGLSGHNDWNVWKAAQAEGRLLISQDLNFSDTRRFAPGTHYGLLLVRLRNPGRRALTARVETAFSTEDVAKWSGCFVVLSDRKIRVTRPKSS
jgi:predicted nuclease of predicted toxin-antitoxin system